MVVQGVRLLTSPVHELRRSRTRGTVLLTGASGLVGQALLDSLGDRDVICLSHRTPITRPGVTTVHGDLMQPKLGMDDDEYLCARQEDRRHHPLRRGHRLQPP